MGSLHPCIPTIRLINSVTAALILPSSWCVGDDPKLLLGTEHRVGIHGRPYIAWDGVNGNYQTVSLNTQKGSYSLHVESRKHTTRYYLPLLSESLVSIGVHLRVAMLMDFAQGYCTHGSILFPTWHRPYLSLFEVCQLFPE